MKASNWWVAGASSALALTVGLCLAGRATAGPDEDAAGIRSICGSFVIAWNAHDAKAMAAGFAEDGDMVGPDGVVTTGRAEIEKAFAAAHGAQGPMRESSLDVVKEPLRFVTSDVAVSDAVVHLTGAYGPDGTKAGQMTLLVTNVWKKSGGSWGIFANRVTVKPTEPAPAPPK